MKMSKSIRHRSGMTPMTAMLFIICLSIPTIINAAANNNNYDVRKARFLSAMRNSIDLPQQKQRHSANSQLRKQEHNQRVVQSLLQKATYVPPKQASPHAARQLADYYAAYDDGNAYYAAADDAAAANDDDANQAAADDAAAAYYYQQRDDDLYLNYGFDLSTYSLKYAACSSISTFSDDLAEDEDSESVLRTDQYVVFRFCPSESCSSSSATGCMGDYGEYMLPIADWLEVIAQYREEEFERYCDYCTDCDANGNYYHQNDNANRNRRADEVDDVYVEEGDEDPYANGYCSACYDYNDLCNDEEAYDYSNFFNCVAIDVNDDQVLYIGPHCASDKSAIVLTLFNDEYCSNYVGDQYDVSTITGLDLTTETLMQYYNNDCIACKESELAFQDNDDENDNQDEDNDITEVCETLYDASAKCNIYMYSYTKQSYQSSEQASNERTVCSFIESVVTGAYDEKGYIYFDASAYSTDNKYNQFASNQYQVEVVTAGQMIGLVVFSTLVLIFLISSCVMHSRIQRKNLNNGIAEVTSGNVSAGFVRTRSGELTTKAIPRQNSGIMACRSEATACSVASGGGGGGASSEFMGARGTMV